VQPPLLARREFLERVLVGLSASAGAAGLAGCDDGSTDNPDGGAGQGARIAIIGAGMAGLHCAYRLEKAGLHPTIYEASKRVGRRMFTGRGGALYDGQVVELGGELVDTGHMTMRMLAKELDIRLDDRDAVLEAGSASVEEVFWVEGKVVPESVILTQFKEVAPLLQQLYDDAESDEARLQEIGSSAKPVG